MQATRRLWAEVQNAHLERHGHAVRVDHRSLADQGIDRAPERHLGGRGVRKLQETDISALLERRAAEGEQQRAQGQLSSIIDLSGDLAAAKADQLRRNQLQEKAEKGMGSFEQRFAQWEAQQAQIERERQRAAQELAKQRAEAERQQQPKPKKERGGPDFSM